MFRDGMKVVDNCIFTEQNLCEHFHRSQQQISFLWIQKFVWYYISLLFPLSGIWPLHNFHWAHNIIGIMLFSIHCSSECITSVMSWVYENQDMYALDLFDMNECGYEIYSYFIWIHALMEIHPCVLFEMSVCCDDGGILSCCYWIFFQSGTHILWIFRTRTYFDWIQMKIECQYIC